MKIVLFYRCEWCRSVCSKEYKIPNGYTFQEEFDRRAGTAVTHLCETELNRTGIANFIGMREERP